MVVVVVVVEVEEVEEGRGGLEKKWREGEKFQFISLRWIGMEMMCGDNGGRHIEIREF